MKQVEHEKLSEKTSPCSAVLLDTFPIHIQKKLFFQFSILRIEEKNIKI
jgi:hypothetical protein